MNTTAEKKYFTVAEANRTLPLVRAIVDDIVQLYRDVDERRERLSRIRQLPGAKGHDDKSLHGEELRQVEEEIEKDIERVKEFSEELNGLGAELKDPLTGLVDFRTLIDGREAYLCWKLGEDQIVFWHELDAGFQGRQSIDGSLVPEQNDDKDPVRGDE